MANDCAAPVLKANGGCAQVKGLDGALDCLRHVQRVADRVLALKKQEYAGQEILDAVLDSKARDDRNRAEAHQRSGGVVVEQRERDQDGGCPDGVAKH